MIDVRKALHIKIESPYWDAACQQALAEPMVPEWLTEGYLRKLHRDCGVLPNQLETILSSLPYVVQAPELCFLAKILYHILATKKKFGSAFTCFELPKAPRHVENTIGYDCFAIFPVLAHLRFTWEELQKRGIEAKVLTDSLRWADSLFTDSSKKAGKPAFTEEAFRLYGVAIYVNHLIIDRLRFEIYENSSRPARVFVNRKGEFCALMDNAVLHKSGHLLGSYGCTEEDGSYAADFSETANAYEGYAVAPDTGLSQSFRTVLSKKEWRPVYTSGDNVLKVHIPYGSRLDKAACEESYKKARALFSRCFPEIQFTGFVICCWMLSPVLKSILPPQSNIIAFQEKYHVFPAKSSAADAFLYVFGIEDTPVDTISLSELPETNSLMRGIKQKALSGEFIHQFNGFFPW